LLLKVEHRRPFQSREQVARLPGAGLQGLRGPAHRKDIDIMVRRHSNVFALRTQLGIVALLALASAAGTGCAAATDSKSESSSSEDQLIDVPLGTAPAFTKLSGAVVITMADETAEVYVNAADSSLMVNGVQAVDNSTNPPTVAIAAGSTANVKTIAISDTTGSHGDVLILNYINGLFGQGKTGVVGTTVAFKSGSTNAFVLKGGPNGNNFAFGASGMTLNNAASTPTKDVTVANASSFTAYLGAGNDKFTAGGNSAIGGAFASAVTIYGGAGNDTLVEGTASTPNETFSGGPGSDTVDYSARTAAVSVAVDPLGVITSGAGPTTAGDPTAGATEGDLILDAEIINGGSAADQMTGGLAGSVALNGNAGNDVFFEGDDTYKNGSDTISGGAGVDTVDYSARTHSLTIVMDGSTASGDHTGNANAGEGDKIGTDVEDVKWGGGNGTTSTVTGNAADNVFTPGLGTNTVNGLAGNDTLNEGADANNAGNDTFNGGTGVDVVDYSARSNPLVVVMDGHTHSGDTVNSEADVIGTDVENLYGGSGADALTGNALDNDIEGNAGDDVLAGLGGNDTLVGAAASQSSENNVLHGNDTGDTAEPGALNLCINIGTGNTASPATAMAGPAVNCEVTQF
jgi:Ca2+-binding RTX toxin-like protein